MADKDIFRPPQATAAELAAASGIVGEIVYNTTTGRHQQWDGAAWVDIGGSGGSGGHVIRANGTSRPARAGLNFSAGFSVTDDNGNDETDVELARAVNTQHSLTGGGTLSQDRTLSLVGDTASPGASKVYGTDASGVRGWQPQPSGGGLSPAPLTVASGATPTLADRTLYIVGSSDGSGVTLPSIGGADRHIEVWTGGQSEPVGPTSPDTIDGQASTMIPPWSRATFTADAAGGWAAAMAPRRRWDKPPEFTFSGSTMVLDFQRHDTLRLRLNADFAGQFPLPSGLDDGEAPVGSVRQLTLLIEQGTPARAVTNAAAWGLYAVGEWPADHEVVGVYPYIDQTAGAASSVAINAQKNAAGQWRFQLQGMQQTSEMYLRQRNAADNAANYTFGPGDNGVMIHVTPTQNLVYTVPANMPADWSCVVKQHGAGGSVSIAAAGSGSISSRNNSATLDGENAAAWIWVEKNPTGGGPTVGVAGNIRP